MNIINPLYVQKVDNPLSENGVPGLVSGTYGIGTSNKVALDIVDGEVKGIYIKEENGNYKDLQNYIEDYAPSNGSIEFSFSGSSFTYVSIPNVKRGDVILIAPAEENDYNVFVSNAIRLVSEVSLSSEGGWCRFQHDPSLSGTVTIRYSIIRGKEGAYWTLAFMCGLGSGTMIPPTPSNQVTDEYGNPVTDENGDPVTIE